jgi:hypothetical protein
VLLLVNQNPYKWRTKSRVLYLDFHCEGGIIGVNRTSTDLETSVWHQVVASRPSHVAGRAGGLSPPTRASPPRVDMWQARLELNRLKAWPAGQGVGLAGQPFAHLSWGLAHLLHMSNTPRGDDNFDIWSTSLCHPLECSNLVPEFLKSNKH